MPQLFGLLVGIIVIGAVLYFAASRWSRPAASPLEWLVTPDVENPIFRPDKDVLVRLDNRFMERVAQRIESTTQCQTTRDGDLIRVYKKHKLIGIVYCCEVGRNATPATVRNVVELAEHLHVRIMYLATNGPAPLDTQKFARLQKVKLISV